jgi:pimeloyl-ACP methyl ester carboxylesterase
MSAEPRKDRHAESRHAMIGGRQLAFVERGAGDKLPLVLLHGIGSNGASFAAQLDGFGGERRVLAWNAPGYGDSAPFVQSRPTPSDYADVLAAWLEAEHIERCVLLGHSLGALTATRFAVRHPERIAHLILSSPAQGYGCSPDLPLPDALQARIDDVAALGPAGMAEKRSARTLADSASPTMLAAAREAMASVTTNGYKQAVWSLAQGTLGVDARAYVAARPGALTFFCGTADRVTPLAGVAELAASIGCHDLRPIEGAGHASYLDHPDDYNAALRDVLMAVDAG